MSSVSERVATELAALKASAVRMAVVSVTSVDPLEIDLFGVTSPATNPGGQIFEEGTNNALAFYLPSSIPVIFPVSGAPVDQAPTLDQVLEAGYISARPIQLMETDGGVDYVNAIDPQGFAVAAITGSTWTTAGLTSLAMQFQQFATFLRKGTIVPETPLTGDRTWTFPDQSGPVALNTGGPTASRPVSPVLYQGYHDTDLGFRIDWNGSDWVDGTGSTV